MYSIVSVAKAPETPGARVQDKRASVPPCSTPPADEEPSPPSDGDATPVSKPMYYFCSPAIIKCLCIF